MTNRYSTSHLPEDQYEPGSDGTVLHNLLGISNLAEMEHVEEVRFEQLMEVAAAHYNEDHCFTTNDIIWLHKTWLEGVFSWAGAYRTVNIGKGGFMFAAAAHIPELMRQFENDQLARLTPCRLKDSEEIVKALAEVHVELILIHPFREGNGRIARLLSMLMGLQAGLPPLDFSDIHGIKRDEYFAAVQAGLDRNYQPMETVFRSVVETTIAGCNF